MNDNFQKQKQNKKFDFQIDKIFNGQSSNEKEMEGGNYQ